MLKNSFKIAFIQFSRGFWPIISSLGATLILPRDVLTLNEKSKLFFSNTPVRNMNAKTTQGYLKISLKLRPSPCYNRKGLIFHFPKTEDARGVRTCSVEALAIGFSALLRV